MYNKIEKQHFYGSLMKTIAYIRVSTVSQDLDTQRLAILSFSQKEKITIDAFQEIIISSRKKDQKIHFDSMVNSLNSGDTLIVSELSRVGRSLGSIIDQINKLLEKKINFICIKEGLKLVDGKQDLQSKIAVAMFGLFAEVERDLISERTKEGIINARANGKIIGRPKGKKGKSKLDGKEKEIIGYLHKKVSRASIARILEVSANTLNFFISSRNLVS